MDGCNSVRQIFLRSFEKLSPVTWKNKFHQMLPLQQDKGRYKYEDLHIFLSSHLYTQDFSKRWIILISHPCQINNKK